MPLNDYIYALDLGELSGPVTGDTVINDLLGNNLSVTGGQLDAAGGGFGTKATATGQEGEYVFDAGAATDMSVASVSPGGGQAFAEKRTGTFAADGNPSVRGRGPHSGSIGGEYLYTWEFDPGSTSGGATSPSSSPHGITWDGDEFVHTDNSANYIYTLDTSFAVTGGTSAPTLGPVGIGWNGSNYFLSDFLNNYMYLLDSGLSVAGGSAAPSGNIRDAAWIGNRWLLNASTANYLYELDESLSIIGGSTTPTTSMLGLGYDGERILASERAHEYIYRLDKDYNVVGGGSYPATQPQSVAWDGGKILVADREANYIYEFAGSYDFTIGTLS